MWPHWRDERLGCVFVDGWWLGGRYRLIYTLPPTFTITYVTHSVINLFLITTSEWSETRAEAVRCVGPTEADYTQ